MWHKVIKIFALFCLFLTIVSGSCGAGLLACGAACYLPTQYCCLNGVLTQIQFCPTNTTVPVITTNCGSGLLACGSTCYNPTQYCCYNNVLTPLVNPANNTSTPIPTPTPKPTTLCGAGLLACGDACYLPSQYCCLNGALTQIQFCPSPGTTTNPVTPRADVTIVNNCKVNLFIEARMGGAGSPITGYQPSRSLTMGNSITYNIPDTGASGTRFWAKYGCDSNGKNCLIGDSMQYWPNPPGGCPTGGCQVPVDSLFEATFGCKPGTSCNSASPTTWFDTSQVDGWTLPYRLTLYGATNQCDCTASGCPNLTVVDGSHLDLANCPTNEDASANGKYPTSGGRNMSGLDLRLIANNQVIGCMSPCKKLNYGPPAGYGLSEGTIPTLYMCCPTPNPSNCLLSNGCILPNDCRAGPIANTQFVKAVHSMAPGVYAYSYDDGVGLHACPAGTVQYQMEFCPAGSATYPLQL